MIFFRLNIFRCKVQVYIYIYSLHLAPTGIFYIQAFAKFGKELYL